MTGPAADAQQIVDQFERRRAELPGGPNVLASRRAALSRFAALGFPTRRLEEWRYTDVGALRDAKLELLPAAPTPERVDSARAVVAGLSLGAAALRCVFVDGHLVPALSELPEIPGLECTDLASSPDALGSAVDVGPDDALLALNTAFASQGVIVRIADDVEIQQPIQMLFVDGGRGFAPQVRIVIEMAKRSAARCVQYFADAGGDETGWLNLVTDARLAAGSKLGLYRLQGHSPKRYQTSLLSAALARDASLVTASIDDGGALVRNDYQIALDEPGASADLVGIALAASGRHVDNHIKVDHKAPDTHSRETFRSIVDENGHAVFNGKIVVRENAQKIVAHQRSDNLLLSRHAEVDTRPELEIYADDVKCSHGATVGELDEDHLFYLRARGLDEETARGLLTFAFANEILERIDLPDFAAQASARIAQRLPDAPKELAQ